LQNTFRSRVKNSKDPHKIILRAQAHIKLAYRKQVNIFNETTHDDAGWMQKCSCIQNPSADDLMDEAQF